MPLRALIFDLDDTLLDTSYAMRQGIRQLGQDLPTLRHLLPEDLLVAHRRIQLALDPEVFAGTFSAEQARARRFELLLREHGDHQTPGEVAARMYRTAFRSAFREVEGAASLIGRLRARGLKIGVLTNYLREVQLESLEAIGLHAEIDALVTVNDAPPKPDPRAYTAMLEALDVPASQALMVGDSWENDVLGAERAGIRAIWLNRHSAVRPKEHSAAPEVTCLDDVQAHLEGSLDAFRRWA